MATADLRGNTLAPTRARTVAIARSKRRVRPGTVLRHATLIFFMVIILLPLVWVLILSVKSLPDAYQGYLWPRRFDLSHYPFVIQHIDTLPDNFRNSFIATGGTIMTTTISAVLGGYALVHLRLPGRRIVFAILVASLFFPTRVTSLIAIYQIQRSLGLINNNPGLILPYSTLSLALCVFIMKGIFESISVEIRDAARIDGAGAWRTLLSVMLPIARNGVVVVVMVAFVSAWGEFLIERTLIDDQKVRTLPLVLASVSGGMGAWAWPRIAAVYAMAITPGIVIFALVQRWYMRGLTEGALKG